jgi:hypothetical protein
LFYLQLKTFLATEHLKKVFQNGINALYPTNYPTIRISHPTHTSDLSHYGNIKDAIGTLIFCSKFDVQTLPHRKSKMFCFFKYLLHKQKKRIIRTTKKSELFGKKSLIVLTILTNHYLGHFESSVCMESETDNQAMLTHE